MTGLAAPRVVEQPRYGRTRRHYLRPAEYRSERLIAELADAWVRIAPEIPGSVASVRSAICVLGHVLADLPGADELDLAHLRVSHLDRWEQELLRRHRIERTDNRYRQAVHVFALLRRISDDDPDALHPAVAARVRMPTRLVHTRRPGDAPFDVWERRRFIAAAKRCLAEAVALGDASPGALTAALVLLCQGTGEPVEVLRATTLESIDGSLDGTASPIETLERAVAADAISAFHVTLTKRRSHLLYDITVSRSDRIAHWSLGALITLTAPLRAERSSQELWLYRHPSGEAQPARWDTTSKWSLRSWSQLHVHQVARGSDLARRLAAPLTPPIVYRRFRKHVVATEAAEDPTEYFATRRRHSPRTFFTHYASSTVLRGQAGRIIVDAVTELFDAATAGPTIVTADALTLLAAGEETDALDASTAADLAAGRLGGPLTACRDPLSPPEGEPGPVCGAFANGRCYTCPNAIVTRDHLPGVLRVVDLLEPSRYGRPEAWREVWGPTHTFLTKQVLPQFSPEELAGARAAVGDVYLDPSLEQELGSA